MTKPACLYVITHDHLGAHKIGVAGCESGHQRLAVHRKYGWQVYRKLYRKNGEQAIQVERSVLRDLRVVRGIGPYLSADEMPQGGYTETLDYHAITLPDLWRLTVNLATQFDESMSA